MTNNILFGLCFLSAIGCGINSGIFFVFSNTVMNALGALQSSHGVTSMQNINRIILNPSFFLVFLGTAATSIILAISLIWRWQQPGAFYLLVGCLLYLFGCFLVTIVFNVPLNNALEAVKPESTEAATLWSRYLIDWTVWNHVRTAACILGSAAFTLALCKQF